MGPNRGTVHQVTAIWGLSSILGQLRASAAHHRIGSPRGFCVARAVMEIVLSRDYRNAVHQPDQVRKSHPYVDSHQPSDQQRVSALPEPEQYLAVQSAWHS